MSRNWGGVSQRDLIRRRGAATTRGVCVVGSRAGPKPLQIAPSKAQLRAEAEAALATFTGTVKRVPPTRGGRS
jgi:hypothetical protein